MTVREEFDAFCLNQTMGAGAKFRKITQIHAFRELPDMVVLSTSAGDLQSRFLVGADGANSQIRGLMGHARWFRAGFALEGQVDCCSDALRGSGHDDCPFACHT